MTSPEVCRWALGLSLRSLRFSGGFSGRPGRFLLVCEFGVSWVD